MDKHVESRRLDEAAPPARRLRAVLDHVACAVPDAEVAERRWREQLGGGLVAWGVADAFASRQLRFAGGGKLELLSPVDHATSSFVRAFLERFGAQIHHVTLKVPDLGEALDVLAEAGLETVDVSTRHPYWHEAFLRPSQVGGLVVQVAWSLGGDEDWAERIGHVPQPPRPGAATLIGPRLRHPDLDAAARVWSTLGAHPRVDDGVLVCSWPDSPLRVEIERGAPAGPVALRFSGAGRLEADPQLGPAVYEA